MSNNAVNVRPTFRDSSGNPRAYGLLYFYENNSTTLATIYSDEALTVAQSNPYTLDAYGRIQGDCKYTGKLTVKATNSDGSDPITDDNVEAGTSLSVAYTEQFEVVASDPAALTVKVKAGNVMNGETLVVKADQTTTAVTAPVSNPRIDRIVVDRLTGVYSWVTGSEAASPTAPAIPTGKMPAAQIALATTTTAITDSLITDERVSGSVDHSNVNAIETLTNKTIDSASNTLTLDLSEGTLTGTTTQFNTALSDNDFATLAGIETFTNKTLTSPAISSITNTGTLTLPTSTDTLVGRDTTDTLTNKTLASPAVTGNVTMPAAGGLDFSANTGAAGETSSLFDWYEEGTWTIELWDNTLATDPTPPAYSSQTGIYTRIGRNVYIEGYLAISDLGTLTTTEVASIGGLPFTSANTTYAGVISVGSAGGLAITANSCVTGLIQGNTNYFTLHIWDATTGTTSMLISEFSASGFIWFSGNYTV